MKVSELIAELQKLPQDVDVVMSADSEGNYYSLLRGIGDGMRFDKSEGTVGYAPDVELPEGYGEEDVMHDGIPCVVFWP